MPEGQVLEFAGVTKRFRGVEALAGLDARIEPGVVTGFLGPNGAGKTTSMRILLGLVSPTSGRARIGGSAYADLKDPLRTVGSALEASSFHPGRSAANHLAVYARAAGIGRQRIDDVLGLVGLADVAGRKVGGFSLGMRQRLGLATALLGDPGILVLDEPANGLDPEGIKWMRMLLGALAAEGRTVLVSSHLLGEIQQTADHLLIIARGRVVFDGSIGDLADPSEYATVVDAPDRAALSAAVAAAGLEAEVLRTGLTIRSAEPAEVGAIAAAAGVALSSLQRRGPALEEIFLALADGTRVHASVAPDAVAAAEPGAGPDEPASAHTTDLTPVPDGAVEPADETTPLPETSIVEPIADPGPAAAEGLAQPGPAAEPTAEPAEATNDAADGAPTTHSPDAAATETPAEADPAPAEAATGGSAAEVGAAAVSEPDADTLERPVIRATAAPDGDPAPEHPDGGGHAASGEAPTAAETTEEGDER